MDAILDIIDQALREKGLSDAAASKLAVGHPSLLKNLRMPREGEKRYNLPSLMRLAEVLDLEFYFGPRRDVPHPTELGVIANADPSQLPPTGFLTIPWHGAGPGSGSAPVAFSRAWLDRHQLKPDFLQAVLPDRYEIAPPPDLETVALIDTRTGHRKGAGLWCLRDAGRTIVARMTFAGEQAVIHPATQEGEARILEARSAALMGLIGRVVWLGQLVPLKGKVE